MKTKAYDLSELKCHDCGEKITKKNLGVVDEGIDEPIIKCKNCSEKDRNIFHIPKWR
jgi:uncharacterized Zn finger protein